MRATIFDIERNSYVDGPGIRTTVFFKGCNLRCAWCHNPESQRAEREMLFYEGKCRGCGKCKEKCANKGGECRLCGTCALYCPADAREICGKEYTVDEVVREILKDKAFYEASGGGVTFSGGECMLQIDFLEEILKECKREGIHTAVDTAGHVPFSHFERILPSVDLFLYDLKCFDSEKHRIYTGAGNEKILQNLWRLIEAGKEITVRIPLVPTVNDSKEELAAMGDFLRRRDFRGRVELLPYHAMGRHKYAALGRRAEEFTPPDDTHLNACRRLFADFA